MWATACLCTPDADTSLRLCLFRADFGRSVKLCGSGGYTDGHVSRRSSVADVRRCVAIIGTVLQRAFLHCATLFSNLYEAVPPFPDNLYRSVQWWFFPTKSGGTAPPVSIYGFASCRVHVGRIPEFSKRGQSGCVGGSPPVGTRSKSQITGLGKKSPCKLKQNIKLSDAF